MFDLTGVITLLVVLEMVTGQMDMELQAGETGSRESPMAALLSHVLPSDFSILHLLPFPQAEDH